MHCLLALRMRPPFPCPHPTSLTGPLLASGARKVQEGRSRHTLGAAGARGSNAVERFPLS
jgi:hypothetical protein